MTGGGRITGPKASESMTHGSQAVLKRALRPFIVGMSSSPPPNLLLCTSLARLCLTLFHSGNRQCVGKNLALIELRLVTTLLLKRYKVRFAPDYDPDALMRDLKYQVTAQPGECPTTVGGLSEVCTLSQNLSPHKDDASSSQFQIRLNSTWKWGSTRYIIRWVIDFNASCSKGCERWG